MRTLTLRKTRLAAALLALVAVPALAQPPGPPAPNANTTISVTPTPVVLSGDAAADAIADTQTSSASLSTTVIDEGKVTVQMATLLGVPVTTATPGFTWTSVPPGNMNPSGGATSTALDFDGLGFLPGTTASFRAHYVTGGGAVKADTHFSPAIDVSAVGGSTCEGFNISADFASGNGGPAPGSSGPWAFRITLENCSGVDLTGIKAQGGSNGWAPMTSYVASKGTVNVKKNNKNEVLTWNLDMPNGSTETLLVNVNGNIPASAACDSIRYLSGAWSAVYDAGLGSQKSDYTGRVSIQVTCPAP
jgi:hypothetical protein